MNKEEKLRIANLTLDTLNNFVCEHQDCCSHHGITKATHVTSDTAVFCDEHAKEFGKEFGKVQTFEDYCRNTLPAALQLLHNLGHNYEGTNINASLSECRGVLRAYSEQEVDGMEISMRVSVNIIGLGADYMQELEKKIVTKLLE